MNANNGSVSMAVMTTLVVTVLSKGFISAYERQWIQDWLWWWRKCAHNISTRYLKLFFLPPPFFSLSLLALQPPLGVVFYSPLAGFSLLAYEVSWSLTTTRHSREDSSERMISPSQRPLPDKTQHSQHKHPCPGWYSNTRSQQTSGRRPTP